ncbi:MAG: hypothetical protein M1823_001383 [Watsoniomyces obsoletus]|nr:MAG: hypothetical protein M1823_001383 [Watsoniomyces obsoletus]
MVNWISLVVPFAYLSILVGSLATFSSLYRKRKNAVSTSLAPWFPPHLQRNIYLSLLHLDPEPGQEKAPAVPESVLKAALLRRAAEDVYRTMQIRNAKQALSSLLARGSVGDDLWKRFQRAESEMEEELRDVVMEANAFSPNWGQTIFLSANEMAANGMLRKRIEELQSQTKSEKEWWEQRRATIQTDFMKELDQGRTTTPTPKTDGGVSSTKQQKLNVPTVDSKADRATSDEDTVVVEGGGPTAGGSIKGNKKKKSKK